MDDTIDVLLATYNGEKYIREQIESLLSQTYKNFRLIISDDCSKDSTRAILKEYEEKDNRIEVYYQENNLGCIGNFEFLLNKVKNDIYMFSDQDDYWLPTKIEHTYKKMKVSKADLVFTDLEVVDNNLSMLYQSFNDYMKLSRKIKKCIGTYKLQYLYNCVTGCTLMSKKEFLDLILPLPRGSKYILHDAWIADTVANNGKIEYLDEKTIKYRQHTDNQVGIEKISHKFSDFNSVRNLFLDVKIDRYSCYVNNDRIFPDEIKEKNEKALRYFEHLKKTRRCNFKYWEIFHDLYKEEVISYYILNFFIMNFPGISKIGFKVRYCFLKALGKR